MAKYKIAGLIIEFKGAIHKTVINKCQPYICSDDMSTDITINVIMTDELFQAADSDNTYGCGGEFWYKDENVTIEYLIPDENAGFLVKIVYANSGKNVDVYMFDAKKHYGFDDTHYLSNTISILFHYLALLNNRLVLHSSSVFADGFGVAFSADSGVGKSTHTSLWIKYVPGCKYLNDDTPIIYIKNKKVYICGTPFAGSTGINTNETVPLKAIVFIKRGKDNFINRLDTPSAISHLMGQIVLPSAGEYVDSVFSILSDILTDIPVYELYCNMEYDAVKTSYEGIFNKQLG